MRHPQRQTNPAIPREFEQLLSRYALAAAAAGVGILGSSPPAEAEVVYTPANQQIAPNTTINIDLNHDGITDFSLKDTFSTTFFSSFGRLSALPAGQENRIQGHTVSNRAYASALFSGAPVGPKGQFLPASGEMAELSFLGGARHRGAHHPGGHHPASVSCTAPWANVTSRYLGFEFVISGKVHFGWARVNVSCSNQGSEVTGVLTGYAYETIPNLPVITGRQKGIEDVDNISRESGTSSGEAAVQAASLGRLAQGASGLTAWRSK